MNDINVLPNNLHKAYQEFNATGSDIHRRNGGDGYSSALIDSARCFDVTTHELADYVAFEWGLYPYDGDYISKRAQS